MHLETIRQALQYMEDIFQDKGLDNSQYDARNIVSQITRIPQLELNLHYHRLLTSDESATIIQCALRRVSYEPLQYIFGETCFMGFDFQVNHDVLIPRKETELLVERVVQDNEGNKTLLDIGTGSGNIALSISKLRSSWQVDACDISEKALQVARTNALSLGVEVNFILSDLFSEIRKSYDLIVSNPPYISPEDYNNLSPEVKSFEPQEALLASENGYYYYRRILHEATGHLNPGGLIYFEIGYNQGSGINKIAEKLDYRVVDIQRDYQHFDRIVKLSPKY